ncbi:SDR family oxidoreductase [Mycolicibacterium sp. 018/SC-01/001]|uniref:SDR family oxidoreductase n=1 Tax=Mycolicibacterium sp. 018/SC-01/001 TaxID=2592069 RepID=UPI0011811D5B|nr:SDR family oxidoreductase [Mycolicibacterium sp. 018/SC-01/001]TRW82406.1 SDR family oxidoreductase [Mycolicibacterium sp. 018/SC-01/001]
MDVLITGCDTDRGRIIAENFSAAGHRVIVAGRRADDVELLAKELETDLGAGLGTGAVVVDTTDPASIAAAARQLPAHIDTVINVPAPRIPDGDPRAYTLADRAAEWRGIFDAGLLSAVLTVQTLGDQLRSGGSIVTVIDDAQQEGGAAAAVKAAVSTWTAGQAHYFGVRGITVNAVAIGRGAEPGYEGLGTASPTVDAEIARLALFLTTPSARHITGQTLHVSHGALANFG